jgi:hypothetical protein
VATRSRAQDTNVKPRRRVGGSTDGPQEDSSASAYRSKRKQGSTFATPWHNRPSRRPDIAPVTIMLAKRVKGDTVRYYFHMINGHAAIPDNTGIELEDPDQVRLHALKALEEINQENPEFSQVGRGWRLNVADASGSVLFSLVLDGRTG